MLRTAIEIHGVKAALALALLPAAQLGLGLVRPVLGQAGEALAAPRVVNPIIDTITTAAVCVVGWFLIRNHRAEMTAAREGMHTRIDALVTRHDEQVAKLEARHEREFTKLIDTHAVERREWLARLAGITARLMRKQGIAVPCDDPGCAEARSERNDG